MSVLRNPAFRLVWCSSLATAGAQLMERVATGWLVLDIGGDALTVGIVMAARSLPPLVLGLAAGTIADRCDRRRWLMLAAMAAALLATTLGLIVREGHVQVWHIAAIASLFGCASVADIPARQALVVDTVGRAAAPSAIAWNAVASRFCGAVGALAGGLAIPLLGTANCYFVVAVAYLLNLAFLAVLRLPANAPRRPVVHPPFGEAVKGAFRLIVERPQVRTLALAAMACEVFGFSYATVLPTFARDVLRSGAEGLGLLNAAAALGATLAVLLLAGSAGRVGGGTRREKLLATVYLAYGLALLALAFAPNLTLAASAIFVVGGAAAAFDALQHTLIQLAVPDDQRGSAVGVWVFSTGMGPIGHLESGALAAAAGAPGAFLANGLLVAASAVFLGARAPAFRWREMARRKEGSWKSHPGAEG